jgi:hypothetical protein
MVLLGAVCARYRVLALLLALVAATILSLFIDLEHGTTMGEIAFHVVCVLTALAVGYGIGTAAVQMRVVVLR